MQSFFVFVFLDVYAAHDTGSRYSTNVLCSSETPLPGVSVQRHQSTVSKNNFIPSIKNLPHSQELLIIRITQRNDSEGGVSIASKRTQLRQVVTHHAKL
jgi:hypothetical protein